MRGAFLIGWRRIGHFAQLTNLFSPKFCAFLLLDISRKKMYNIYVRKGREKVKGLAIVNAYNTPLRLDMKVRILYEDY